MANVLNASRVLSLIAEMIDSARYIAFSSSPIYRVSGCSKASCTEDGRAVPATTALRTGPHHVRRTS